MRSLLWLVLSLAVIGNVFVGVAVSDGPTQVVLSSVSGLCVLGCGIGLYATRDRSGGSDYGAG
ncbi:hypothetical protein GCM10009801_10870 [Streptomyces albiaxialis]|uniref:Uncharacterized protein n=1 Tax=Streptomyces albiaxialis TaxID=329523 RepID=A0ABN2VR58_9ACTN